MPHLIIQAWDLLALYLIIPPEIQKQKCDSREKKSANVMCARAPDAG